MGLLVRRLAAPFYHLRNFGSEERDCQTEKIAVKRWWRDIERLNLFFFLLSFPSSCLFFLFFPPDPFVPQLFPKIVLFRAKLLERGQNDTTEIDVWFRYMGSWKRNISSAWAFSATWFLRYIIFLLSGWCISISPKRSWKKNSCGRGRTCLKQPVVIKKKKLGRGGRLSVTSLLKVK